MGAERRRDRPARAGATARVARRIGGGRGAVTVTSGSVTATCPVATSGNTKPPVSVSPPTDAAAPRMAPTGEFPYKFWNIRQLWVS